MKHASRSAIRRAFTLVELLVALAVTVVVLLAVATIFGITSQTASQSAAVSEVQALADRFARRLRDDLDAIDPASSVLVVVGRTQLAARTEEDRQAGLAWRLLTGDPQAVPGNFDPRLTIPNRPDSQYSDPRADLLMFFADMQLPSVAPARQPPGDPLQKALRQGARIGPVQIVYGHASLAVATPRGTDRFDWSDPVHIETAQPDRQFSPLPLTRWVLARRVLLLDQAAAVNAGAGVPVFRPDTWADRRVFRLWTPNDRIAADVAGFNLTGPGGLLEWLESEAARDAVARPDVTSARVLQSPYAFGGLVRRALDQMLYGPLPADQRFHHVATVVEQPPPGLDSNLALQALSGCAWFEVQFLMPEDPRNSPLYPDPAATASEPRWLSVEPGRTYVFVPDSPAMRTAVASEVQANGRPLAGTRLAQFGLVIPPPVGQDTVENRIIRLWPYAIRVTVRVFDRTGRLEQPVVRTVTHWFD